MWKLKRPTKREKHSVYDRYTIALKNFGKASDAYNLAADAADAAYEQETIAYKQYVDARNARDLIEKEVK